MKCFDIWYGDSLDTVGRVQDSFLFWKAQFLRNSKNEIYAGSNITYQITIVSCKDIFYKQLSTEPHKLLKDWSFIKKIELSQMRK